jgi:hypothetical protein
LLMHARQPFPHERSDLSHWRKRLGDKLELLLAESLRVCVRQAGCRVLRLLSGQAEPARPLASTAA